MTFACFTLRRAAFVALAFSAVLPTVLAGCQDRPPHQFTTPINVIDGGPPRLDLGGSGTGSVGAGGRVGSGGVGSGGAIGTGGSGVCVPTGPETCGDIGIDNNCDGNPNDVDPGQLTDLANCGACFNLCNQANAENIQCLQDTNTAVVGCHFSCLAGFKDADSDPKNGCECQLAAAIELCNGKDDNCNNVVDEGFDLMTDIVNCGRCGVTCSYPFARASCNVGVCAMGVCLAGFFDANGKDSDGCECQKTNGGAEVCDGIDNNCDGRIDEPTALTSPPTCRTKGVCAGVTPTCHGVNGWSCDYPVADFQLIEDMTKLCDGKDNDCDGLVDEAFDIGKACQVGTGPCAGAGTWICGTAGDRKCNGTMKAPKAETCNGLDDDCDGKVDELDATTDDKVVYSPAPKNLTVFAYEATRFDADATQQGVVTNHRPCSVAGKRPWSNITAVEAAAACAMIGTGWRLCTTAEWGDACNGPSNTLFPYGATYNATSCVGYEYSSPAPSAPLVTGAAALCVSETATPATASKLFDMSGNVKEWTSNSAIAAPNPPYEIRGGAYDITGFTVNTTKSAPGLQCDASTPAPVVDVRLPSVGFRCCMTGQIPAN